ncbi:MULTISPECIES: alpha/beta hydrolase [Streptomyces]|uniref:alpha/beta hydrolase n=1 Tax=Streptomyces TaxID=1883 RepID=UPI001884BBF3|nr:MULTISPECIES: alpha/beta hydrolase [Streptomyces]MBF8173474.1 alpha/beta fold hydrolase [Streptomyces olivaceus]MBZ6136604.1 alpha/beta hydrolase [Streptomyces olivaceus]MBZ6164698.1 alpha/beta hydrolase [Streptomyces olivaceus]MBZ6176563.1 alpha/beta hydrolase [Streptomyces olivaceus]MBZ6182822.1 alpha/beta hydrolase [Streptomyces olivaceus]
MHTRRTHRRTRIGGTRVRATLVAAALLATACSASGASTSAGSQAEAAGSTEAATASLAPLPKATPAELSPYYEQKLGWRDCGVPGFQCATMKAPLDYAKPTDGDVRLAVARKKATGPGKRLGSLLVNPGGPGGSAIGYLQQYAGIGYPEKVRAQYDMVAVDPRGVARSEPVECLDGREMDAFTRTDATPDDERETDELVDAYKDFAEGCGKDAPKLLRHVSTVEAARDMDVLRAVLGDEKLNYVGASYGTFLGATYAGLFPERAGRLVLDGAMDPSLPARRLNLEQTQGFETAFQSFAKDCAGRSDCPLGGKGTTPDQAGRNLTSFFDDLDAKPLPAGDADGRRLTESLATTGVIAAMYDEAAWQQLREALTSAMKKKDGAGLLVLSDSYYEREADGSYSNLMFANAAVNCLDLPAAFSSPDQVREALPEFEKASPVFGEGLAWASLNCTYWPVQPTGEPHRIKAAGATPIVVVGTTRDPATPYRWAEALADQLSSGRLLTYEGDGHTAYGRGSTCIDSAIDTYLLTGTAPKDGKRCS